MTITFVASSSGDILTGNSINTERADNGLALSGTLPWGIGHERPDTQNRTTGIGLMVITELRDIGFASYTLPFLRGVERADNGYAQEIIVPTASIAFGIDIDTGEAIGTLTIPGTQDITERKDRGVGAAFVNFMFGYERPDIGFSIANAPLRNPISLLQDPGYMQITGIASFLSPDILYLSDSLSIASGWSMGEKLSIDEDFRPLATRHALLGDTLKVEDELMFLNMMALTATLTLTDSLTQTFNVLLSMADILQANDTSLLRRDAIMAIAINFTMKESLNTGSVMTFADGATVQDALTQEAQHVVTMMEALDVADTLTQRMAWVMASSDALNLTDALTAARAAQMGLMDSMFIGGVFNFAGEAYTVYAMTTVGAAVSQYDNFNYNSMFTVDGISYGVMDTGEFRDLTGPDDAGSDIDASVRLGLQNFGTALFKSCPNVYIGYTSTGALLMEVITTARGVKKSNWYKLNPIPRASDTGARFDPAKGLHSKYWSFEISNVDGADFNLDFVHVWRMILSRRK